MLRLLLCLALHSHKLRLGRYLRLQRMAPRLCPNFYRHWNLQSLKHLHRYPSHRYRDHVHALYADTNFVAYFWDKPYSIQQELASLPQVEYMTLYLGQITFYRNRPSSHNEWDPIYWTDCSALRLVIVCTDSCLSQPNSPCAVDLAICHSEYYQSM